MANRSLLAHALTWLSANGVPEAAVVVPGELAVEARDAVADGAATAVRWLEQPPTGTLPQALASLLDFIADDPVVLHFADSLAKDDLGALCAAASPGRRDGVVMRYRTSGGRADGVVDLSRYQDGPFGGVLVLGCEAAAAVAATREAPGDDLGLIASEVSRLGGHISSSHATEWWRHRSDAGALLEGNRFALEGLQPHYEHCSLIDTRIQGGVVVHPTARLESTTVRGPAIIGPDARVRDAYIGPYTAIGRDVAIEAAEIENSIILRGASISHLGGRLEASVVGPNARVFRDFRLPRALRLTVGAGAEVSVA